MKKLLNPFIALCLIASFYFVVGPKFFEGVFTFEFFFVSFLHALKGLPFFLAVGVVWFVSKTIWSWVK